MSTDNQPVKFEWTDELVKEFADNVPVDEMSNDTHIQHFKASKQPKRERIEVLSMAIKKQWGDGKIDFECQLSYGISKYLFPAIKQAIESVLNKDTVVEDSSGLKTGIMSQMDMYNMGYKDGVKYAQFTKPEQPTNDNAFVRKSKPMEERDVVCPPLSKQSAPPIVKDKEVLFTTEDGVEITEWMDYWYVEPHNDYKCHGATVSPKSKAEYFYNSGLIKFSTKEAAEQYILENKPCLSLNDLLEVWDTSGLNEGRYYGNAPLYKNFEKKAKQKLKK